MDNLQRDREVIERSRDRVSGSYFAVFKCEKYLIYLHIQLLKPSMLVVSDEADIFVIAAFLKFQVND